MSQCYSALIHYLFLAGFCLKMKCQYFSDHVIFLFKISLVLVSENCTILSVHSFFSSTEFKCISFQLRRHVTVRRTCQRGPGTILLMILIVTFNNNHNRRRTFFFKRVHCFAYESSAHVSYK